MLNNGSSLQVEVDLFELLCKVLDQNLFAQVDWARNSYYFKELKVGDEYSSTETVKERKKVSQVNKYRTEVEGYPPPPQDGRGDRMQVRCGDHEKCISPCVSSSLFGPPT
jgi:hypothetical protein